VFRRLSIAAAGLLICVPLSAAAAPPAAPTLQKRASDLLAAFETASGAVAGVCAVDLKAGRQILSVRADDPFIPASNQKLLTAAFALARLGSDFRFVTGVFLLGEDVLVAGEGDPTLGDPRLAAAAGRTIYADLDRWAAAVRQNRGRRIRHVLLCEPPGRAGRCAHWRHDERYEDYAAPVSTLNFHNNCFDVTFIKVSGGLAPIVRPRSRYIRVESRLKAGRDHLWSLRTRDRDARVVLSGTISRATSRPTSVAVDHPSLLLGRTLAERLAQVGVTVTGQIRQAAPRQIQWSRARAICRIETPLFVVMHRANKRSLNMAAEAILLRAGDGTWPGSAEMMTRTLTKTYGLPAGSVAPTDGSGLSRDNRASPGAITKLLLAVARRPDAVLLLASLPVGGIDGTLAARFTRPPCRGRIIAKTGHLYGVSCLSGYVLDEQRRARIAFSILVNRFRGPPTAAKDLQEALCRLLLDSLTAPGETTGNSP